MTVTRGHHFIGLNSLPSASLAVFFLGGFYLSRYGMLLILLSLAGGIDYLVLQYSSMSDACLSPAYSLLLPAYATLWLGGKWYKKHYTDTVHSLFLLTLIIVATTAISELFSGGGYYFYSGQFNEPNLLEYSQQFIHYYPNTLLTCLVYISITVLIHSYLYLTKFQTMQVKQGKN